MLQKYFNQEGRGLKSGQISQVNQVLKKWKLWKTTTAW